ncbi:MAG: Sds3-like-domain-containing protein [Benniella sp.]|nr:MAG: Sds3-like-domain-containing protein [Benniella sp.]
MLEATSLRSRKHSASPTDTKNSSVNTMVAKDKAGPPIANDSGMSLSGSVEKLNKRLGADNPASSSGAEPGSNKNNRKQDVDGDVDMKDLSESQDDLKRQSIEKRPSLPMHSREKLSAEDLNGGLLDGALDDVDDDDLDGDTEDTEAAQGSEGVFHDQDGDDDNEGDHENEDDDKRQDSAEAADSDGEAHDDLASGNKDEAQSQNSHDSDDGDGDLTMGEHDDDAEDEGSPEAHTDEEESDHPEEEESHADEDEDDAMEQEDEEDEEEDEKPPAKAADVKKDAGSYPQKPVLNRPSQLIEEELKDSGDDLSDLSEFDDSDDSDDEVAQGPSKAKTGNNSSSATTTSATTRATSGGRKRSLRDTGRDTKEQEEKAKRDTKEAEDANDQHSDKESESEAAENEEARDEKAEGEDDAEEEEDLEKKQLHMDALEALTTIEIEFAALRDKMYEERMLELDKEVEMINDGTHPELSTLMREIEEKREQRLRIAKAWRTHMGEIAQSEFEIKEYQAHCTFQSKKRELRVDIRDKMGKNMRKLGMELTLSSDSRRKNIIADRYTLVRARKHRRLEVNEMRKINEHYGFPASATPSSISAVGLEEDFEALGLPRPTLQVNTMENGVRYQGRSMAALPSPRSSSAAPQRWRAPEYSTYNGPRAEVEIYVDGNRCKVDGTWYKPNDPVVVLDAVLGEYNAKYLFSVDDKV